MNKAYRVIWNACTNTWTAVQENAKAKGKSSSGRVSAEPATLGSLGLKSSRFVCTALVSALMMTAGYANAGPGIFINDGNDDGCIVTSDESSRRNALFFLTNNNLEWAAGQASGGSMPSANAFRNKQMPSVINVARQMLPAKPTVLCSMAMRVVRAANTFRSAAVWM